MVLAGMLEGRKESVGCPCWVSLILAILSRFRGKFLFDDHLGLLWAHSYQQVLQICTKLSFQLSCNLKYFLALCLVMSILN